MKRLRSQLTYANVMVTVLAVLVVGGGPAYAASQVLPKNSVGSTQLKNGAVTPTKLSRAATAALSGAQGAAGATGAAGPQGAKGDRGPQGDPGIAGKDGTDGKDGKDGTDATIEGVAAGGSLSGTYPDPAIKAGAVGTAQIGKVPAASVFSTEPEEIALPPVTPTAIPWTSSSFDTDGLFDPAHPTQLTAPVAGTYLVTGIANIDVSAGEPNAQGFIELREESSSGSNHFAVETINFPSYNGAFAHTVTGMVQIPEGGHVEMWVSQGEPTATLYFFSSLSMAWVGP